MVRFVPETVRKWKETLRPLKAVEPKLDGMESGKVRRAFLPLGAKLQPGMDEGKAQVWTNAMVASLSNLPSRCIVTAMQDALHKTFRFPTDLEDYVRVRAEQNLDFEVLCVGRLRRFMESLTGTQQPLQLEQRNDPMTKDEIRELVTQPHAFTATLIRLGLGNGSIDATLLAQVRREEGLDDDAE